MFKIRQVCKKDNLNLSNVIRKVLTEIGVPKKEQPILTLNLILCSKLIIRKINLLRSRE